MAKKQNRNVSKITTVSTPEVAAKSTARTRVTSTEFNPDYTEIKNDLKRIGTLAGSFFVILIVLSFFLR
jgi:hypothetical protein